MLALACFGCAREPVPFEAVQAAPAPDLLARRELALGARPLALLSRDFDQDGFDDLAVVTEQPGQLRLFAGSPGGLVAQPQALAIGDFPSNMAPGSEGFFVASKATGELLSIRVADIDGTLTATLAERSTPGGTPRTIAWSESTGRLLWATTDERVLAIDEAGDIQTLTLESGARVVGIVPSSKTPAFALLCQGTEDLRIFADVHEHEPLRRIAFDGVPRSGCEADFDGDGELESAFIGGDRRVLVFGLGDEAGFAEGEPFKTIQPNLVPGAAQHWDLDGDGREELISLGLLEQGYVVLGDFAQNTCSVLAAEYAGQNPVDLALGDFDGDGRVDLAVACRAANAIALLGGSGSVSPGEAVFNQAQRTKVGANPLSIAAADLLGARTADGFSGPDGRPEIVTLDAADGHLSLLANDGAGGLDLIQRLALGAAPRGLNALSQSGRQLLLGMTAETGAGAQLFALEAGPSGQLASLPIILTGPAKDRPLPAASEAGIISGDVNGDGQGDLLLLDPRGPKLHILLGASAASAHGMPVTFEAIEPVELPGSASAMALTGTGPGAPITLAIGHEFVQITTTGAILKRIPAPPEIRSGRGCSRLLILDLDGDGEADDLAALWLGPNGTSPGLLTILCNLDQEPVVSSLLTGLAPADLIAGDLNGDGLPELLVSAQNSHMVNLWTNAGAGSFQRTPDIGAGLGPMDLALADITGNGLLDLLVVNAFSSDVSRVFNRPRSIPEPVALKPVQESAHDPHAAGR